MNITNIKKSKELWKAKAKNRTIEIQALRKEKGRLQESRNMWKEKYQQVKNRQTRHPCLAKKDIKRHTYNSLVIFICLSLKLYAQQSVRGISKSIRVWIVMLGLEGKAPCHTTIHTWLRKSGYNRLYQPKERANAQWVLFVDESVCMGKEKLLLILGVDIRCVQQGNLSFSNSSCLYLSSKNSWKGKDIAEQLNLLKEQLTGKVRFAVIDRGNNIKKAFRLADIPYIHDLTHEMALYLGQLYGKSEDFKAYTKWTALLRRQLVLSDYAHVMPPEQRSKARFHNMEPLYQWGKAIEEKLKTWQQQDKSLYEKFKKIAEFKLLLQELESVLTVIKQLKKRIAEAGIRKSLLADIFKLLKGNITGRPAEFCQKMSRYFQESHLKLGKQNIPVCCSDLIESAFGKYKMMMSGNEWNGITDLALAIPAFMGNSWDQNQIKNAFEEVKVKDYKQWAAKNMEDSLLKKRKKVFKKLGQK